jgi:hypothetical protein
MNDLSDWRAEVVYVFLQFVQKEVSDLQPSLLEICCWRVLSLLTTWRQAHQSKISAKVSIINIV